jgi:hypothetical protein
VQIGDSTVGGAQLVAAPIALSNSPSYTDLVISNYQDTADRTWHIDSDATWGWLSGMTPAYIYWNNADINSIALQCGRGGDQGYISRLSETLSINNANGDNIDFLQIGNPAAAGMQQITQGRAGGLTIDNDPDFTQLFFNNYGDSTARIITFDLVNGYNQVTGLAPATIRYDDSDTRDVSMRTGSAIDVINVLRTATNGGTLMILQNGPDRVILGNGNNGMQGIVTDIGFDGIAVPVELTLYNRFDTAGRTITQARSNMTGVLEVTGLFPGTLRYVDQAVSLTVASYQLLERLVQTNHRTARVVRPVVHLQHVLQCLT